MDIISVTLTVFYEGQFYVGILSCTEEEQLTACRMVFGGEPKDYEVQQYLLENWHSFRFSPPVEAEAAEVRPSNPKRMQREIARKVNSVGAGTKSQQALQLLREQNKQERTVRSREEREREKQEAFQRKQEQKKEKRKGH